MKRSFFLSLLLHSMLLVSLGIGFFIHKKRGIEIPNDTAVIVNFTKIGPRSQAPIIGQPSALPPSEEKEKKEAPKKALPSPKQKEQKKALPEKGDIAKKDKVSKKEQAKNQDTKGKKKNKEENTLEKKTTQETKAKASSSSPNTKKPITLGPEDAQRADEFGLEIVTTDAALIKGKLDKYWAPPEIAENSGVKIRVFIQINAETGRITNYHVVDRKGPSEYYTIFENRIAFVLNNPDIDFLDLSDETRKLLAERGLEVVFDADTNEG